jgi:hypothetical protein
MLQLKEEHVLTETTALSQVSRGKIYASHSDIDSITIVQSFGSLAGRNIINLVDQHTLPGRYL